MVPQTIKPKAVQTKRRFVLGEPFDFRGLRFAPVNEQGVVYLFGMISHELGYLTESVRTEYPDDCEGKRCFDKKKNKWEHVRIEFEYKSSHFLEYGHNENECEIIVCWIHDNDPLLVTYPDYEHSNSEERFIKIGNSGKGMVLLVVHTESEED